jgi:hypothetical protein
MCEGTSGNDERCEDATGRPRRHATTSAESTAARRGDVMLIFLKIVAGWTAISVVVSFSVAPALSRRLRDINFPRDEE